MKLDEGSRETRAASRVKSNAADEHGMGQVWYQRVVSIAQAVFMRHRPEHTYGHVYMCVYTGVCMERGVLTSGQYTHMEAPEAINTGPIGNSVYIQGFWNQSLCRGSWAGAWRGHSRDPARLS